MNVDKLSKIVAGGGADGERHKSNPTDAGDAKITLILPFPPPLSGQTAYSLYLKERLKELHPEILALPSRNSSEGWRGIFRKVVHSLAVTARLAVGPRRQSALIILDGGIGLVFNLLFVIVLRVRGAGKIFLSHHSFAYIDREFPLMAMIVRMAGPRTTHLFLSDSMKKRFLGVYGTKVAARVVSNVRRSPSPAVRHADWPLDAFTLGYLSNITFEKGIAEYFDLVEALVACGENVQGKIAGPASTKAVEIYIQERLARCGGRVTWIGPVHGRKKEEFLSSLSILVFPTNYINEAQPNVLFEALSHGVPVITIARGCIEDDMAESGSLVARSADTFLSEALPYTRILIERHNKGEWAAIAGLATHRFAELYAESQGAESELIKFMLDPEK